MARQIHCQHQHASHTLWESGFRVRPERWGESILGFILPKIQLTLAPFSKLPNLALRGTWVQDNRKNIQGSKQLISRSISLHPKADRTSLGPPKRLPLYLPEAKSSNSLQRGRLTQSRIVWDDLPVIISFELGLTHPRDLTWHIKKSITSDFVVAYMFISMKQYSLKQHPRVGV